jgi:hypothetical protein
VHAATVAAARRPRTGPTADLRRLTLPDDPLPPADAVVGEGHTLNDLPDAGAVERALVSVAAALRPGGVLALDLCTLEWGRRRRDQPPHVRVEDDWALVARFSLPRPDLYVREMTVFVREDDGRWRRDDERHDNVLLDTSLVPALLARHGVRAHVHDALGTQALPPGLVAVVGRRSAGG